MIASESGLVFHFLYKPRLPNRGKPGKRFEYPLDISGSAVVVSCQESFTMLSMIGKRRTYRPPKSKFSSNLVENGFGPERKPASKNQYAETGLKPYKTAFAEFG
jgi:hypothetical protein